MIVQVRDGSNNPVTGLTPSWLFYGTLAGVAFTGDRRPLWREIGQGTYVFQPFYADKSNGAVWVADFGGTVSKRYHWGVVGSNVKAFLRVASGVPAGTTTPTLFTYFNDGTPATPTSVVGNLSGSQAGLFVLGEPAIGVGLNARKPWSDKGALSIVDLGGDAQYRYQSLTWGDGKVETIDLTQLDILAAWPAELPQEPFAESGARYTPRDNTIATESETGPTQRRRRFTGKQEDFSFAMNLNPAQMAVLQNFYRATLAETRKFTWLDFRTLAPANYRFAAPPDAEYYASQQPDSENGVRHWWRVQIALELVD